MAPTPPGGATLQVQGMPPPGELADLRSSIMPAVGWDGGKDPQLRAVVPSRRESQRSAKIRTLEWQTPLTSGFLTRRSDAQARERRPLVGTARRRRAAGRTPSCAGGSFSAEIPAFRRDPYIANGRHRSSGFLTRRSDAQARERRPLVGTARRRRAAGKDPQFRGGSFSAGIPAFGVIRTLEWQTPFVRISQPRERLRSRTRRHADAELAHGADATRRSDAQARERRPLGSSPGGARHSPPQAGGGRDPQLRGGSFSAGIPAFGVIRTLEWQTPFVRISHQAERRAGKGTPTSGQFSRWGPAQPAVGGRREGPPVARWFLLGGNPSVRRDPYIGMADTVRPDFSPGGATRRQGNADLWSAQPAEGGRREGPPVARWFLLGGNPSVRCDPYIGMADTVRPDFSTSGALAESQKAPRGR